MGPRHGQMFPSTGQESYHLTSIVRLLAAFCEPVACLPRSHEVAENAPCGIAKIPSPGETTSTSGTLVAPPLACLLEPKADFVAGASLTIDGGALTGPAIGYPAG
jgi:hypothetical protein